MKARLLAFAALLLALAALVLALRPGSSKREPTLGDLAPDLGLSIPGAESFAIRRDVVRQGETQGLRSLEAASGNRLLKIEVMTGLAAQEAAETVTSRVQMIHSLFSNIPSPYPGMVTNTTAVPDELLPRVRMIEAGGGVMLPLYLLASSDRRTYGAMSEEMVAYRGGLYFLYDQATGTLYRFDSFVPKAEFAEEAAVAFLAGIRLRSGQPGHLAGVGEPPAEPAAATPSRPAEEAAAARADAAPAGPRFPGANLILIAFEPLGANHVSACGYEKKTTPNLDAFAEESLIFTNAMSPSSWSLPVFMSWFTSLYPSQHKVVNKYSTYTDDEQVLANLKTLSPEAVPLAQVFRRQGYRTAAFTGGASLAREFGFGDGFEQYFDEQRLGGFDLTMPKALAWLAEHRQERVFLFVQGYDVHGQFPLEREGLARFLDPPYQGGLQGTEEEYWDLRNRNLEQGRIDLGSEDLRLLRAVYDAKIFAADRRFGAFIQQLRDWGLLENSIVMVSSGSGNEYGEHGRIDHGHSLYEELIHVPLLIRLPSKATGRVTEIARTIDLMPTALDLLDLPTGDEVKRQMRGVSLAPLVSGGSLNLHGIAETDYLSQSFKRTIKSADGWKLIVSLDTEARELYNLKDDPGEQRNLAATEGRRAYELEQRLFDTLKGGAPPPQKEPPSP